jgi:aminoglycoside phosphotransferase (APT) family kinase protein
MSITSTDENNSGMTAEQSLARWLADRLDVTDLVIDTSGRPPLNGQSNDTLMLRARWRIGGREQAGGFVVRRPPSGRSLYHHYDLASQYATMRALVDTDVPVPPLVGYEPDATVIGAPFYVMGEVVGEAPPDVPPYTAIGWVLTLTPQEQARMHDAAVEVLARIHRLDIRALPLGHLPTEPVSGFDAQFQATLDWYAWATAGTPHPVLANAVDWLQERRPRIAPDEECLNWGDARVGNMLFRDLSPVAVLDWEMAAVGPPEVDLGWWLFLYRFHTEGLGNPRIAGFPDDEATVAMWERSAGRTALDIDYYVVLAGLRMSIIVHRHMRRMVEEGTLPPERIPDFPNPSADLLARLIS